MRLEVTDVFDTYMYLWARSGALQKHRAQRSIRPEYDVDQRDILLLPYTRNMDTQF